MRLAAENVIFLNLIVGKKRQLVKRVVKMQVVMT